VPTMSAVRVEPPVTAEECEEAGNTFGRANQGQSRFRFEELLLTRLAALEGLFKGTVGLCEDCLAAFDRAAWDAWERPVTSVAAREDGWGNDTSG
jgi:hypothetical protein